MGRFLDFVRQERVYFLLIIFILLINAITVNMDSGREHALKTAEGTGEIFADRAEMEKFLSENRDLAVIVGLVSLLVIAVIMLGLALDILIVSLKLSKGTINISTSPFIASGWPLADVGKVAVLFLFFGHVIIISESFLSGVFPFFNDENIRMILNSCILDILAVVFIVHFAARHRQDITALGISARNFFRNVLYGLTAYIALVPALVAALALILLIVTITKYVPEKQPVVELFMNEKNASFLFFSSVFAAIIGPVIEEIYFRAFMYKALKRRAGLAAAAILSSAIFAALHSNIVGFVPIFMLGILLVYLYEKTGTLVASMTVHITHNLGMVFFVFLLRQLKG